MRLILENIDSFIDLNDINFLNVTAKLLLEYTKPLSYNYYNVKALEVQIHYNAKSLVTLEVWFQTY